MQLKYSSPFFNKAQVLRAHLYLILVDLYAIYRPDSKHQPALKRGASYAGRAWDGLRMGAAPAYHKRLAWFIGSFLVYQSLKGSIVSVVQYARLSVVHNRGGALFDASTWTNSTFWSWMRWLESLAGNPLRDLGDTALFIYNHYNYCAISLILLVHYYTRRVQPINFPALRAFFSPAREIKRIDLCIREKLYQLNNSILSYHSNGYKQLKQYHLTCNQLQSFEAKWHCIERNLKYLRRCHRSLAPFRPAIYARENILKLRNRASTLLLMCLASNYTILAFFYLPTFGAVLVNSNPQSKIYLLELVALVLVTAHSYSLHLSFFGYSVTEQHELICDLRNNFTKCLIGLQSYRMQKMRRRDSIRSLNASELNEDDALRAKDTTLCGREELVLEQMLLGTIIRSQVLKDEIDTGFKNLAIMLVPHLCIAVSSFTVTLFTDFAISNSTLSIRWIFHIYNWLGLNGLTLSYAYLSAEFIKAEKICWSILAENAVRLVACESSDQATDSDFFSELLHRTSYSYYLRSQDATSLRPTFRRIIESNFFLVSTYSLLKKGI